MWSRWIPVVMLSVGCGGTNYDAILALEGDPVFGQILYINNCRQCHGESGQGVSGPALTERVPVLTGTQILQAIDEGPGNMPSYEKQFDGQDKADLLEYLTLEFQ